MENAKVIICDDRPSIRQPTKELLESAGHEVVAEADSKETTAAVIGRLERGELHADVVLVDGGYGPGRGCKDGKETVDGLMDIGYLGLILGFSSHPLREQNPSIPVHADTR